MGFLVKQILYYSFIKYYVMTDIKLDIHLKCYYFSECLYGRI